MSDETPVPAKAISVCRFTNSGPATIICTCLTKEGEQVFPMFEVGPDSAVIVHIKPCAFETHLKSTIRKCRRFMKVETGFWIDSTFCPYPPPAENPA